MRKSAFIIFLFFPWLCITGFCFDPQTDPDYRASEAIFNDTVLPEVYITLSPESLSELLLPGNEINENYYPACLHFKSPLLDDSITTVGVRLRGKVSRYAKKKSFKISFNKYVPGRRFHGIKKMNLKADHYDPCIIRSKICSNLFREFGLPCSRLNHLKLFINESYWGLYMNVEQIDDLFLKSRFGNRGGNLYKCVYVNEQADLSFRHDARYDLCGDGSTYELKTNTKNPDYSDLAHFIDVLNNTPDHIFSSELEKIFNVQGFLKWMTVTTNCGSWDDYLWTGTNYYLYHNPATGRIEFIPYDFDLTLGIEFGETNRAVSDIYEFSHPKHPRPLANRILDQEKYLDLYSYFQSVFLVKFFTPEKLEPEINRLKDMIAKAAENDPHRPLDFNWTIEDFHQAYTQSLEGHIPLGLFEFIRTRREHSLAQIRAHSISEILFTPSPTPTPSPSPFARAFGDCETTPTLVINEFCASNRALIADSLGEYDDWIEIYNFGDTPVSLGGMYLTDDPDNPKKRRIPEPLSVPAGGFILLWADGDIHQGSAHLGFRLSRGGEMIGLYDRDDCNNREIDKVFFNRQQTDVSFGREFDGDPSWVFFRTPTPGAKNNP